MKFSSQLQQIMHHFGLGTTELADKILVPKATISHLISERNKPSLEFIMKLHTHFPSLNLEWLIYGKLPFLVTEKATTIPQEFDNKTPPSFEHNSYIPLENKEPSSEEITHEITKQEIQLNQKLSEEKTVSEESIENNSIFEEKILSFPKTNKSIENIVIFYSDGSFKSYKPE